MPTETDTQQLDQIAAAPEGAGPDIGSSTPAASVTTTPSTEQDFGGNDAPTTMSMAEALEGFEAMGLSPDGNTAGRKVNTPKAETPKPEPKAPAPEPAPEKRGPGRPPSRETKLNQITDLKVREVLKHTPNAAFDALWPLALAAQNAPTDFVSKADHEKALAEREMALKAEAASARYFDHEEGYQLTPEYQELNGSKTMLGHELDFWSEQLDNLRSGKPVHWLELGADGKPTIAKTPLDPKTSPGLEGKLISKITQANTFMAEVSRQVAELPKSHKAQYAQMNSSISAMDKSLFGPLEKNENFQKAVGEKLKEFPAFLRGRGEIGLLAKALVSGNMFYKLYEQTQAAAAKKSNATRSLAAAAPDPEVTGDQGSAQRDAADTKAAVAELDAISTRRW
jgi:hypothetical protein